MQRNNLLTFDGFRLTRHSIPEYIPEQEKVSPKVGLFEKYIKEMEADVLTKIKGGGGMSTFLPFARLAGGLCTRSLARTHISCQIPELKIFGAWLRGLVMTGARL
jgi:hypothetical protein